MYRGLHGSLTSHRPPRFLTTAATAICAAGALALGACNAGGDSASLAGEEAGAASALTAAPSIRSLAANNLCLGVGDAAANNGSPVQVLSCNSTAQQTWTYTGGTLQLSGTKCLDVVNGTAANGTQLQVWDCAAGNKNQQWAQTGNTLVWNNTFCLDLTNGSSTSGTRVQIWSCAAGNLNQQWALTSSPATTTPTAVTTAPITSHVNKTFCVDSQAGSQSNGALLAVNACTGAASQSYSFNNGSITQSGKCFDVVDGGTANGTHVQLYDCYAGNKNQQWSRNANTLVAANGLCLDLTGGNAATGQVLQLWQCDNGVNVNQQWDWAASATSGGNVVTTPVGTPMLPTTPTAPTGSRLSAGMVRLIGRSYPGPANLTAPQTLSWAASGAVATFTGSTQVTAVLSLQNSPALTVAVDGVVRQTILNASDVQPITGLDKNSVHTVQITKLNEAVYGTAVFSGFAIDQVGAFTLPPAAPVRKIEIIGDSITNGYGDLGNNGSCAAGPANEDVTKAYGPLTAAALSADVAVIASQGWGMYANYQGDTSSALPKIYNQAVSFDSSKPWDFSKWTADIVVINLGTNDFWAIGTNGDGTNYIATYRKFIATIRANYPNSYILCGIGPMLQGQNQSTMVNFIQSVVAAQKAAGDKRIAFVDLSTTSYNASSGAGQGCQQHPNTATQASMATQLTAAIKAGMNW